MYSQTESYNRVWFKDGWLERIKAVDQLVLKILGKKPQAIDAYSHITTKWKAVRGLISVFRDMVVLGIFEIVEFVDE